MLISKRKNFIIRCRFIFRFHKALANNVQRWVCVTRKCKAFLKTSRDGKLIQDSKGDTHNHEPPTGIKRKAQSRYRDLDAAPLQNSRGNDLKNFCKSMTLKTWGSVSLLPKTLQELMLFQSYGKIFYW